MAPAAPSPRLHEHAEDNLRFIRDTMARASGFTAVPGWGGLAMGLTAVLAAFAAGPPAEPAWLTRWLIEAPIAVAIGVVTMAMKARRLDSPLDGAAARRFAFTLLPTLAAGAVLTAVFASHNLTTRLPGCWLVTYGAAVSSAGAMSVSPVPIMGASMMVLGALSFLLPVAWNNVVMAVGFGLAHIICGLVIARRHGG